MRYLDMPKAKIRPFSTRYEGRIAKISHIKHPEKNETLEEMGSLIKI